MKDQWNTSDLGRRQRQEQVGFLYTANSKRIRIRAVAVPGIISVIGLVLLFVGPVPMLGLLLLVGGFMGSIIGFVMAWLGQ